MIENFFGVIKQYFQIFKSAPEYHYNIQISFVFTITILHNFICIYQSKENIYNREQEKLDERLNNNEKSIETKVNLVKGDRKKINEFCDRIATEMW